MFAKKPPAEKNSRRKSVIGLFTKDHIAAWALKVVKADPDWSIEQVYGPIPSEAITRALNLTKSKLGYFTLAGGIIGFFSGFFLAMFTASQWKLIVSGKPVIALVPFFIVGFEFTILFAVIGNVAGLIHQMQLPDFKKQPYYDPGC